MTSPWPCHCGDGTHRVAVSAGDRFTPCPACGCRAGGTCRVRPHVTPVRMFFDPTDDPEEIAAAIRKATR